jgi:hypothetical protein
MDDKTCRLEILRIFKEFRDQRPNDSISRKERFTKPLRIDENVLDRNIRYLEDKGLLEVKRTHIKEFSARITAHGIDFLETGEPAGLAILSPVTVHQEFHGTVGAVAGRDINVQVSFSEVLNKLADTVASNQKIPKQEKQSLVEKLKSLAENEWVRSIGTSVLADVFKKAAGL